METTRQNKISRLLQKELSEIFLAQTRKTHGTIVSVSIVRISPDLSISHVSLSIFPADKVEATLLQVKQDTKLLRFELGKRVKDQLRIIPALVFHLDDTLDYLENIDNLLKQDPPSPLSPADEQE